MKSAVWAFGWFGFAANRAATFAPEQWFETVFTISHESRKRISGSHTSRTCPTIARDSVKWCGGSLASTISKPLYGKSARRRPSSGSSNRVGEEAGRQDAPAGKLPVLSSDL